MILSTLSIVTYLCIGMHQICRVSLHSLAVLLWTFCNGKKQYLTILNLKIRYDDGDDNSKDHDACGSSNGGSYDSGWDDVDCDGLSSCEMIMVMILNS